MKILVSSPAFCRPELQPMVDRLRETADEVVVNPKGGTLTKEEVLGLWSGVDGIIAGVEPYDEEVLEKAPETLRVISRYGTGYNSVDTAAAGRQGISVTNTPGVNAAAVADCALALILAIVRRIPQTDAATKGGRWKRYTGVELAGKTLGIVGLGFIGKEVAGRAKGFGLELIAYDPYFDESFAKEMGIRRVELDALLREADFVTLHVPVTPETEGMINAESLRVMKSSAFLINTARGQLVEEDDLHQALSNGEIAGAALDVFHREPLLESKLFELENIVVTPHLAGHTNEAETRMAELAIENTLAVLGGKECRHIVNRDDLT